MNYMDYVRFFLIKFLIFDKPEIKKEICKKEEMKYLGKEEKEKEEKSTEEKILDQFPAVAEKLSNLKRRGGLGGKD
jgi:DNA topoisomerase VI subunit B